MNKLVNLSALAALSSALYFSPSAQACDGHEGKGGKAMSRMDKNSDGKVTQQEMLAAMTEHFETADANKDGKVTPEERKAMHEAKLKERIAELDANKNGSIEQGEARGPLEHLFAEIDSDKNGALSSAELIAHKKNRGERHGHGDHDDADEPTTKADLSAKVSERFKRLDKNSDGVVTEDEFGHGRGGHHGHGRGKKG